MRLIASALAATFAVCAIGYVSFFTALPANSAEACEVTKAQVVTILTEDGVAFKDVPPGKLAEFAAMMAPIAGVSPDDVISALIADIGGVAVYGLETKDGCFSPDPIPLPGQAASAGVGA